MLAGPTNDYFSSDHHFRGSFPTPNESSLRTGLTPGGGGSMFPAPSPNSQALYNSLQSGGATPSTLDFHRTAMNVRAASQSNNYNNITSNGPTSQATEQGGHAGMDHKQYNPAQAHQHGQPDPYGHDANDAANGLFLLAQANGARNNNQFAVPPQPANHSMQHMPNQMHQQTQDTSPNMAKRATKNSIGSSVSGSARGMSEGGEFSESGNSEQAKPQSRSTGRGKKGSAPKAVTNGRRKAEDTPSKGQANKRSKGNNGSANASSEQLAQDQDMLMDSDDDGSVKQEFGENGKKMTDEEKRKNFLERNRVAALKCRQRKKQWLANLQAKVELFSTENDALSATVTQLREEVVNLKTLLMAHKDCPVSQSQGISGLAMDAIAGNPHQYTNPYGMAMPQGMPPGMPPGMPQQQQGMQRRFGEPHEQYER
ncbi:Transcription factor [Cryomyces antarcticus]|nr:Transcription factor [Cryomyces antarcticus]